MKFTSIEKCHSKLKLAKSCPVINRKTLGRCNFKHIINLQQYTLRSPQEIVCKMPQENEYNGQDVETKLALPKLLIL